MSDYTDIKKELERIKNKTLTISNSTIHKKLSNLRSVNFELYETLLLKYNKILENLILSEKETIINVLLEKVSQYGEDSLTDNERDILVYYSN